MGDARLTLRGLRIASPTRLLVDGVDLALRAGEIVALIGPSGAGKTLTARALLGMVDLEPGVVAADLEVTVDGATHRPWDGALGAPRRARDRAFAPIRGAVIAPRRARDRAFAPIRGAVIGMLPQDAFHALDPLRRVGWQVRRAAPPGAPVPVAACLRRAGIDDPDRVARLWPHQLSGGMARRVTVAQMLARRSRLVVVDEPTAGVDALGAAALCAELGALARREGLGLLVITHDLRILPGLADRVLLMEAGRIVERLDHADLSRATSALGRRMVAATRRIARRTA